MDAVLARKLEGMGAVLIEGAKWCGKTTTAEQIAGSVLNMDDPAKVKQNIELAVDRQQKWPENRRLKWPEIWENEVEAFRRLHRRRGFRRSLFEVGMRREE